MADLHIGKKVHAELRRQRYPVTLFAKQIGLTRNVAYDIFKRKSMDTGLLLKISKVLNHNFFSSYISNYKAHSRSKGTK